MKVVFCFLWKHLYTLKFLKTFMARRRLSPAEKARLRARLKALRRKHGLGEFGKKKTTSVARRRRTRTRARKVRRSQTKQLTNFTMARRRRSSSRRSRSSRGFLGALGKPVMSGVIYGVLNPFVSQFLSRFNVGIQDELVQILGAVLLKQMVRNAVVNNYANAAIIVNTARLSQGLAGRFLPTATATSTSTNNGMVIIG